MTPKQRQCLDFIACFIEGHRYAPTIQEISVHMEMKSRSSVISLLNALSDGGHITREPFRARSIEITPPASWEQVGKAAERLVASIIREKTDDHGNGIIVVDAAAFGELDVAIKEREAGQHG